MTLKITETIAMELRFKLNDDDEFVIPTRVVNPATRELFRLLDAAPRMLEAIEALLATPIDEYHETGRRYADLQAIVDDIKGGV